MTTAGALAAKLRIHGAGLAGHDVAGGRLEIGAGGQLTCSGQTDINMPKGLWIGSAAGGTGSFIDNGTINYGASGSALVQKYFVNDQWHGYCIPLTQTVTRPYKDFYMKYYFELYHHYNYVIDLSLDSILTIDGFGYMIWSASGLTPFTSVSPVGVLNTGAVSMAITRGIDPATSDYDGWNFSGNPYPSAVDLSSAQVTWTDVDQKAYFWDPGAGNYVTYIKAGGGTHGGVGVNSPYAPAQQGFFVHHVNTSTTVGSFGYTNNSVRVHNAEPFLKETLADLLGIKVINSVNEKSDVSVIRFSSEATAGLDADLDAEKIAGDVDAPQMSFPVEANKILHVNVLPWQGSSMVIPMNYTMAQDANNVISIEGVESFNAGTQIYLEDLRDNKIQDMVANPAYQFKSAATDDYARFVWHFTKSTIGIDEKTRGFQIYTFEDYLYVKNLVKGATLGHVWVYDLTGRSVFNADLKDLAINKYNPGVNEGYYVVRVITKDGVYTQKVYLN